MKTKFYTAIILIGMLSCKSIDKMVERGQYEDALVFAAKKLAGEKDKKTKYVVGIEKAFHELNERDYRKIELAKASSRLGKWDEIYNTYFILENRQDIVAPLLPLISNEGYVAKINKVDYTALKIEASENSMSSYYEKGLEMLKKGRSSNNKYDARSAYYHFSKIEKYSNNFRDVSELKREALYLGMTHIAIEFKASADKKYADLFRNRMSNIDVSRLGGTWEKYYYFDKNKSYDKFVVIEFDDVEFGFEKETVNNYEMAALIEDGIEYVYDKDGKEIKDSLGHKITVPRKVITKAWISEIYRAKESIARAKVLLYNEAKSLPVKNVPLSVVHDFNDSAIKFTGDRRALNTDICNRLDDFIASFPSNYESAELLSSNLTRAIEEALRNLKVS